MQIKAGDKIRITKNTGPGCGHLGYHIGEVLTVRVVVSDSECTSVEYPTCYSTKDEYVVVSRLKETMRKQYRLIKDSPIYKKGAIFEEMCDDGTQDFTLITSESDKYPERGAAQVIREAIKDKAWFEEIKPLYLTPDQIKRVRKLLKIK